MRAHVAPDHHPRRDGVEQAMIVGARWGLRRLLLAAQHPTA